MANRADLEQRLATHSSRLSSGELDGDEHKRVRKRLKVKIGEIRKQLAKIDGDEGAQGAKRPHDGNEDSLLAKKLKMTPSLVERDVEKGEKKAVNKKPTRQERKKKTLILNRQLASLAQRKQLKEARKVFNRGKKQGLVDIHSYTNFLNAFVRCGDADGMRALFLEMTQAGLQLNVVSYTTFMKGLCDVGVLEEAVALFSDMRDKHIIPNIRTINTFLRGCVRFGDCNRAKAIFHKLCHVEENPDTNETPESNDWGLAPDVTTLEYIVGLLACSLESDQIYDMLCGFRKHSHAAAKNPALYLSCARASFLLADLKRCSEVLEWAHHVLGKDIEESELPGMEGDVDASELGNPIMITYKHGTNSKPSSGGDAQQSKRLRTVRQFARHRFEELKLERSMLLNGLKLFQESHQSVKEQQRKLLQAIVSNMSRVLYFSPDADNNQSVSENLLQAAKERFGLHLLAHKYKDLNIQQQTRRKLKAIMDTSNNILLGELFTMQDTSVSALPVKLEIGSGNGEWAVAQAKHDEGQANWITMDLRHDRVHNTFLRAVCSNSTNISVMGGDAAMILKDHFPIESLHSVYINHPEPPERTGGTGDSQGSHLLKLEFFVMLKKLLAPNGYLTIVTDNLSYGKSLCGCCAEAGLVSLGVDKCASKNEEIHHAEFKKSTVTLFEGTPGQHCGHNIAASSYFDRLWTEGRKIRRFYIYVGPST
eukprot:m.179863 g.179863  ORF g.179863 m.179863 type:complete len:708 (+) comp15482_c0_seq2:24-2147(+)